MICLHKWVKQAWVKQMGLDQNGAFFNPINHACILMFPHNEIILRSTDLSGAVGMIDGSLLLPIGSPLVAGDVVDEIEVGHRVSSSRGDPPVDFEFGSVIRPGAKL